MASELVLNSGAVREGRQSQAGEKAAALREADVEDVARAAFGRSLRVDHAGQRFVKQDFDAERFSQLSKLVDFTVRYRLLDAANNELGERLDFFTQLAGVPRFV